MNITILMSILLVSLLSLIIRDKIHALLQSYVQEKWLSSFTMLYDLLEGD